MQGQQHDYAALELSIEEMVTLLQMRDTLEKAIERRRRLNGELEQTAMQARREAKQARGR